MTGFKTACNKCGVQIWMQKDDATGKWIPEDLAGDAGGTGERHKHVSNNHSQEQPREQQTIEPTSPPSGDKKLVKEAEDRVRAIAREEIIKFYVEIATKYERAKP